MFNNPLEVTGGGIHIASEFRTSLEKRSDYCSTELRLLHRNYRTSPTNCLRFHWDGNQRTHAHLPHEAEQMFQDVHAACRARTFCREFRTSLRPNCSDLGDRGKLPVRVMFMALSHESRRGTPDRFPHKLGNHLYLSRFEW